jgi:hypothetical protein
MLESFISKGSAAEKVIGWVLGLIILGLLLPLDSRFTGVVVVFGLGFVFGLKVQKDTNEALEEVEVDGALFQLLTPPPRTQVGSPDAPTPARPRRLFIARGASGPAGSNGVDAGNPPEHTIRG